MKIYDMSNLKIAFLALNFSILCHIFFILLLLEKKSSEKKYAVVDLSNFSKFQTINIKKKEKIDITKSSEKKKNSDNKKTLQKNLETSKQEPKKVIKKNDLTYPKVEVLKKPEKKNPFFEKEKDVEENEKKKKEKTFDSSDEYQKQSSAAKELLIIKDKALYNYLKQISTEINILANKAYPKRSILRREQGKILTRITIGYSGEVINIQILTKRPKNLAKSAEKILKQRNKLPAPPEILIKNSKSIVVEIPINYILK